jgi:glycosyltransferase involved in cell wall biosynthesis
VSEDLLVSVVIPTYRRIDQTIEAVKSVVNQTVAAFEIIVVQDEISSALSEALQNQNLLSFVEVIQIEHSGLPARVRNIGISHSRGNWIGFLDSDDVWFPEKLEKQTGYIKSLNLDCVSASSPPLDSSGETKGVRVTLKRLLKSNFVVNSSVLVKKDALLNIGGIPEERNLVGVEDYAAWLRLCTSITWFHFDEDILAYENLATDRLSVDLQKSLLNHYFAILAYVEWLLSKGNKLLVTRFLLKLIRFAILADNRRKIE